MIQSSPFKPPAAPVGPKPTGGSPFRPPTGAAAPQTAASEPRPFATRPDSAEIQAPPVEESRSAASLAPAADSVAWQAAAAVLPAPQQALFAELIGVLDGMPQQQGQLVELLQNGTLSQQDSEKTVLQRLADFTHDPRVEGMDGRQLTAETVTLLANPDSAFQGTRCTCGPTNLEHQLAENAPALLVELVEGLSDEKGVAPLPTGLLLERVPDSQFDDQAGRSSLDRILQSAFMGVAGSERGPYSMETGCFGNDPNPGVTPLELAKLTAVTTGQDQAVVLHDGKTTHTLRQLVKETPEGESFQCGLSWNGKDHLMLFRGCKDNMVSFFDPERQMTDQMPFDQFMFKTQFVLLPASRVEGVALPEDKLYRVELNR